MTEYPYTTPNTESELPPSADPLADPLRLLKLTGVLHCAAEFTAPWGLALPAIENCIALHIVNEGRLTLDLAGQPPLEVHAGSLVMIPHGTAHQLRSEPGAAATPLADVPVQLITDRYERMRFGGGGERTSISYCGVRVDPTGARRLLEVLPLVIHVDTHAQDDDWLRNTARLLSHEADAARPGSEAVITRLADIVVVQAIRAWMAEADAQRGWLAAMRDRHVGLALACLHRDPSRAWTVAELAREVGLSRSALSARFSDLVGEPVMRYLSDWRLQLARDALLTSGSTLARIAEQAGYQSEAAFSRAFKRQFGIAPGRYRQAARATGDQLAGEQRVESQLRRA